MRIALSRMNTVHFANTVVNAVRIRLDMECNFCTSKCYTFRPVIVANYYHGILPTRNPGECDIRDAESVSKCSFGYLTRLPKLQISLCRWKIPKTVRRQDYMK